MDFLERFFGCSPDGGSGMAELFLVLAVLFVAAGAATYFALKRKPWVDIGRRLLSGLGLERS